MHKVFIVPAIPLFSHVWRGISSLELNAIIFGIVIGVPHPTAAASSLELTITVNELLN
jgi:precorrin-4 methylase